MAPSNWKSSLAAVLKSEGGNDDDPADHGGRTSRGITQREFSAWLHENGLPNRDVWKATNEEVATIYHDEYWNPYCDLLPVGTDYMVFNTNVLAGPHRSAILLQRALGVKDDGRIGPVTRAAIARADPAALVDNFAAKSRAFYISLNQPKFTKGWLNRVAFVRSTALAMMAKAKA